MNAAIKILVVFLSLSLFACDREQQGSVIDLNDKISDVELASDRHTHDHDKVFVFGFDLRSSPQEDARQYLSFLDYLEQSTGYHFKLRFTPKDSSIVDELGQNNFQLAAIGAVSYIAAHEKYQVVSLVRGINADGKAKYQSIIVVRPESSIKDMNYLKGKRLVFGSSKSTQGHLIPRIVLAKHKLALKDFSSYEYTGSHVNCANSVISKKADVCGMQDTMAKEMASKGLLRILYTSDYYPSSGIAVNKSVPDEVVLKIKHALLAFDPKGRHKEGLYNWDKTEMPNGFIEAKIQDYDQLREWSIKLGILKPSGSIPEGLR